MPKSPHDRQGRPHSRERVRCVRSSFRSTLNAAHPDPTSTSGPTGQKLTEEETAKLLEAEKATAAADPKKESKKDR